MKILFIVLLSTLFLTSCRGEDSGGDAEAATAAVKANASTNESGGTSKAPKWLVVIEGLPEKSGRIITAVTMGANGRYSLGRSGFTASISLMEDDPNSEMMFTFSDDNARCFNQGDASVTIDGERGVLSGQVQCMPRDGGEKRDAAIEGWFELQK